MSGGRINGAQHRVYTSNRSPLARTVRPTQGQPYSIHFTVSPLRRPYAKSLAYAQAHMGAVHLRDAAAIDDLFSSLRSLEFDRVNEETGEEGKAKLHEYQVRGAAAEFAGGNLLGPPRVP